MFDKKAFERLTEKASNYAKKFGLEQIQRSGLDFLADEVTLMLQQMVVELVTVSRNNRQLGSIVPKKSEIKPGQQINCRMMSFEPTELYQDD